MAFKLIREFSHFLALAYSNQTIRQNKNTNKTKNQQYIICSHTVYQSKHRYHTPEAQLRYMDNIYLQINHCLASLASTTPPSSVPVSASAANCLFLHEPSCSPFYPTAAEIHIQHISLVFILLATHMSSNCSILRIHCFHSTVYKQ